MHQTKKGNQWHFGMKAHIGVDVASGVVHSLTGTPPTRPISTRWQRYCPARRRRSLPMPATPARPRPEHAARAVSWNIAVKRGIIKALPKALRDLAEPEERALARVRAWVEHPFHIVKNLFRHKKLRYRGLTQEHRPTPHSVRLGQSDDRQEDAARASQGVTIQTRP
jgi:IS5 family transposase